MIFKKKNINEINNIIQNKDDTIKRLMNMIKALIMKTENNEIIIDEKEINEAERYELFETKQLLSFARRYQVVDKTKLNMISRR